VENIPLQAERYSVERRKLFAFPPESLFSFRPECCSESQRNGVQLQTGIAFAFDRIPHQIFSNSQEPPENVRVCFGFMAENTEGATYELSSHPISQQFGSLQGQRVPADTKTFWIDFELKDAIPEVEALKLLKEIYHWFGFTDEQIPYVDSGSDPERVDRARYA
jgi:hypothetical protein